MQTVIMGKRGTLVVPAGLRKRYKLAEGSLLLLEERDDGILAIPATAVPDSRNPATDGESE